MAHDIRDAIMDFTAHWSERTEIRSLQLVNWMGLSRSKFYSWRDRYGKANEHNALVPRDHWLEPWEKQAIVSFHHQFPLEGYRRLTFLMLDRDVCGRLTLQHLSGTQSRPAFAALESQGFAQG